jgi:hypothetical protein
MCLGSHAVELLRLRLELFSIGVGVDTFYELPSVSDATLLWCGFERTDFPRDRVALVKSPNETLVLSCPLLL